MREEHLDGLVKLFKEATPPPHNERLAESEVVDLGDEEWVVSDTPIYAGPVTRSRAGRD